MRIPAVLFATGLALAAYTLNASSQASLPEGWSLGGEAPKLYAGEVDAADSPSGKGALVLRRTETSHPYGSAWLARSMPAEQYAGKRVRISMHVRFQGAEPMQAHVYLGTDSGTSIQGVKFDENWGWYQYTASLPVTNKKLDLGVDLRGPGSAKVDDVEIQVLGDVPPDLQTVRTEHTVFHRNMPGVEAPN